MVRPGDLRAPAGDDWWTVEVVRRGLRALGSLFAFLGLFAAMAVAAPPAKSAKTTKPAEPAAPSFEITPVPSWVRPVAPDTTTATTEMGSNGIFYVLVDDQTQLEPRASYYHGARLITSEDGMQDGASISVSFDPSYQKLTFHTLRLVRNGVTINRLDRSQIKLLQREEELESFLYDGSFTAHCQLEDVRVGDLVEYAYTIAGANPVLGGKYFDSFTTEWSVPVRRSVVRIVYPAKRPLQFTPKNKKLEPAIKTDRGITEWMWDESNLVARHMDANTPRGYHPYGFLQVSEFANWEQVVDWAVPLYKHEGALSPELEAQVAQLRAIEGTEQRILSALRFVQDEIRYLGIESGVGSHQPTAPSEVLRRRFGDCKDKTLLLGTLLRQVGLKATPALVNAGLRNYVVERIPSPGVFNHVILQVEADSSTYWLDATRSHQRGALKQLYTSDFRQALLLRPGITSLTEFSPSREAMPRRKLVETYKVAAPGEDTKLAVVSEFRGLSSESTRSYFQNNPAEKIQKEYLQFYARRYPKIQSAGKIEFEELPDAVCRVTEFYTIPDFWEASEDKSKYQFVVHPTDLEQDMGTPGSAQRSDPLAVKHPINVTQELRVEMFKKWPFTPATKEIANRFFRFSEDSKGDGNEMAISYSYETLADQVPPDEVPSYDATLRKIKDGLGYTFTYRTPEQLAAQNKSSPAPNEAASPAPGTGQFNWPIALVVLVVVGAAIPAGVRYFHVSKLPESLPPSLKYPSLEGLGGWLALVGFGLCVRPLVFLHASISIFAPVFQMERWQSLTQVGQPGYHPLWMPVLLFELIYNALAILFSVLLLFLFFHKRAVWPRCFIFFFLVLISGSSLDVILAQQIPAAAGDLGDSFGQIFNLVVIAGIWIPYCLVSERVKATFRH